MIRTIFVFLLIVIISGCAGNTLDRKDATQYDKGSFNQLGKLDFDRMADYEIRENFESLKTLMIKLYKRNPSELRKTSSDNAEQTANYFFSNPKHKWNIEGINFKQDFDAVYQAFDENFEGDRVLSLIAGLYTMIIKAHGGKTEFYIIDSIEPQNLYNLARNIEIVVWMLSSKKNSVGKLFLVTNEMNDDLSNLSFEREFVKMIGRTDYFAYTLSEKTERVITRFIQGAVGTVLIPFI